MRSSRRSLAPFAALVGVALLAVAARAAEPAKEASKTPPQAAAPAAAAKSDEAALRERATSYWKARVARDPSARDFYVPAEKRPEHTRVAEGGAVRFTAFEIEGVEIQGETAIVSVKVESQIDGKTPFPIPDHIGKRTLRERWDRVDGLWYKQTVTPALRAAAADLQRAFENRRAARAAAQAAAEDAKKQKDAGSGTPAPSAGTGPGTTSAP
jgi:hypothetical protein